MSKKTLGRRTPFDVESLELRGEPVVVLEGVRHPQNGAGDYAVSDNGTLVFVPSSGVEGRSLVWVDRQGQEEPLAAPRRAYAYPRLSPNGTQVALDVRDQENDIWIWDLARETLRRLTFDPGLDRYPVWTPDGQRVALSSLRGGVANLFWKAADGTGEVERLTDGPNTQFPHAFSPDGTRLVYRESAETLDLGLLSVEGDRPMEPLLATEFNELNAELSPDGRWMAYQSNASDQSEIYVRPFPDVNQGLFQVSTNGGFQPLWGPDGRELFYRSNAGLMVVAVETASSFTPGTPEVVFGDQYLRWGQGRTYDIALDGQRFLFIKVQRPRGGRARAGVTSGASSRLSTSSGRVVVSSRVCHQGRG